jgi:hypothetical protein
MDMVASTGFAWSAAAPHIHSLYPPWSPADGYPWSTVAAVEARLGIVFPHTLRHFYHTWGARHEWTQLREFICPLPDLELRWDGLLLAVESDWCGFWGIRRSDLHHPNPPVYWHSNEDDDLPWDPAYDHLSDFLDAFTYGKAYTCAPWCASSKQILPHASRARVLKQWQPITLNAPPWGVRPGFETMTWTLYTRPGQLVEPDGGIGMWVAVQHRADLEDLRREFAVEWDRIWQCGDRW